MKISPANLDIFGLQGIMRRFATINQTDRLTDRQIDRQTERQMVQATKPVPTPAYALSMIATRLIIQYIKC